jgi:hypothetical protein
MEYIVVDDKIVKGHYCGENKPDNAIQVNNFNGSVGEPVSFFDSNWNRKPEIDLYKEGLKDVPKGYKLNDDKTAIVAISDVELYSSGLKDVPKGYKLNEDKTAVIEMSEDEKLGSGIITQSEYNSIKTQKMKQKIETLEKSQDRPLRSLVLGIGTDQDKAKLASIEKEIEAIRYELNSLGTI